MESITKTGSAKVQLNARIDLGLRQELGKFAKTSGQNTQEIVGLAIQQFLASENGKAKTRIFREIGDAQRVLETLYQEHRQMIEGKWKVGVRHVAPAHLRSFIEDYSRIRSDEFRFEERLIFLADAYKLSYNELLEIRLKLHNERYEAYLKKSYSEN